MPEPGPGVAAAPRVEVAGLRAFYGDVEALAGVDLEVPANAVTALIGASGSGKTTLLRCINRLHEEVPRARLEGRVTVDGIDVYGPAIELPAVRRVVGMVFQRPTPFPSMSVYDNVAVGLRLAGARGPAVRETVVAALEVVGLWDELGHRLGVPAVSLSGGQQQRLCIARALAPDPAVILMDEPCSALDPIATLRIERLIGELTANHTIVLVTHNMQQAARVADTIVFMMDGRVIEHSPALELFTRPRDVRTERYVTGNFG
ncbi:phosphate ABC transporter ATP-binding protein [Conexibacter sp. DBS9H8]|uniref:phosphate ABC transporter ATP-binding protein n=1 Tax=Conexibacter sp. DBS9H8 TaxID=2937801 RepID=UPI0020108480|nr:phosphate ABC transporter ATP-binding protein [Conexibacter sp. DBS9H8]